MKALHNQSLKAAENRGEASPHNTSLHNTDVVVPHSRETNNLACISILLFQLFLVSVIQGENIWICSARHADIVQKTRGGNILWERVLMQGWKSLSLYTSISEIGFY